MSQSRAAIKRPSFSTSLVTQGDNKFFTLTMPIEDLAATCFVSTRESDVDLGFQRTLDEKRAKEIAAYIDAGGAIPSSIILSAQEEASLRYDSEKKTLSFRKTPKAFLVIDGQHRIYGFRIAKTSLRVPVVIFNGLSKKEESRLFIDVNTKQRPVPNELLLDIKKLAQYEKEGESYVREIYDLFHTDPKSCLLGLMSPFSRSRGKISRVTFNRAIKPILPKIEVNDPDDVYKALNMYLSSFKRLSQQAVDEDVITKPKVFSAAVQFFPDISRKVSDKFDSFSTDNYDQVLSKVFSKIRNTTLTDPGSTTKLYEALSKGLSSETINFSF